MFLQFAMEHGVAYLLAKIDFVGGSTGWHRYYLIDRAIAHIGEWCLIGCKSTSHWGWGLYDITNQYVLDGINGGLLATLLLIAQIVVGFRMVGRIMAGNTGEFAKAIMAFALGVALLVHAIVFLSLSYFGQMTVLWHIQLATIASLASLTKRERLARVSQVLVNTRESAVRALVGNSERPRVSRTMPRRTFSGRSETF
jgi:hypothetical protein